MRKFKGSKRFEIIVTQCEQQGVALDRKRFDQGADHIVLKKGGATVFYNTFNGRFFGSAMIGKRTVTFNSDSERHTGAPWFNALLEFFYTDDPTLTFEHKMTTVAATAGGLRNAL